MHLYESNFNRASLLHIEYMERATHMYYMCILNIEVSTMCMLNMACPNSIYTLGGKFSVTVQLQLQSLQLQFLCVFNTQPIFKKTDDKTRHFTFSIEIVPIAANFFKIMINLNFRTMKFEHFYFALRCLMNLLEL